MKKFNSHLSNLTNQYFLIFDINIKKYKLNQYIYFLGNSYSQEQKDISIIFLGEVENIKPIDIDTYSFIIKNRFENNEEQQLILNKMNFNVFNNMTQVHKAIQYFTELEIDYISNNSNQRK